MMKTSELLSDGRQRVAHRWAQGIYGNSERGVCMLGAIGWASDLAGVNILCKAESELRSKIAEMFPTGRWVLSYEDVSVVLFNDTPSRTQEEVLSVFDKAILSAQERGD